MLSFSILLFVLTPKCYLNVLFHVGFFYIDRIRWLWFLFKILTIPNFKKNAMKSKVLCSNSLWAFVILSGEGKFYFLRVQLNKHIILCFILFRIYWSIFLYTVYTTTFFFLCVIMLSYSSKYVLSPTDKDS